MDSAQEKPTGEPSNIVMCLGPGRSGTSLTMNIMVQLGLRCSDSMMAASEHNPDGTWEDQYIFNRHSLMFKILRRKQILPVAAEEFNTPALQHVAEELQSYVAKQFQSDSSPWGFKDPRTSLLLPAWQGICHQLKLMPRYVLCLRQPADSIGSLMKNYGLSQEASEQLWLGRTLGALRATAGNVFIVHYEDWLGENRFDTARDLCSYLDLPEDSNHSKLEDLLGDTVKSALNRSKWDGVTIKNKDVQQSYELLKNASGADYDRDPVMAHAVPTLNRLLEEQAPSNAPKSKKSSHATTADREDALEKQAALAARLESLTASLVAMEAKVSHSNYVIESLNEIISQKDEQIASNEKSLATLEEESLLSVAANSQNKHLVKLSTEQAIRIERLIKRRDRLDAIEASLTYRIAHATNQAISRPGINTLLLPWTILKVCFGSGKARPVVEASEHASSK